jgi:hypothetical protein
MSLILAGEFVYGQHASVYIALGFVAALSWFLFLNCAARAGASEHATVR